MPLRVPSLPSLSLAVLPWVDDDLSCGVGPWGMSPAHDDWGVIVSVLVSFVVVRAGSATRAEGLVEHVADADDRG